MCNLGKEFTLGLWPVIWGNPISVLPSRRVREVGCDSRRRGGIVFALGLLLPYIVVEMIESDDFHHAILPVSCHAVVGSLGELKTEENDGLCDVMRCLVMLCLEECKLRLCIHAGMCDLNDGVNHRDI